MPAVELTRLRLQIDRLFDRFDDPAGFHKALVEFLDLHANRAYRPGKAVQPQPLLPSFRVAPLITRQLELDLIRAGQEHPQQALEIAEELWRDRYLEPRILATSLLGAVPLSHIEEVLARLRIWGQPEENLSMLDALFKNATVTLRRMAPSRLIDLIEEWVTSSQLPMQAMGLRAMAQLVDDNSYDNLPPMYNLLSPLLQHIHTRLSPDLYAILVILARRSPIETAYILRQVLSISSEPATARLVRRCLPLFDPPQQAALRTALQAASSTSRQGQQYSG